MRIVGWTPLKHRSSRFPGKNWANLGGRPLFWHAINTALACPFVVDMFVNTDSGQCVAGIEEYFGAKVDVIERKEEHRDPGMAVTEMLAEDLVRMGLPDVVVYVHCTVPLVRTSTLTAAIETFLDVEPRYDSVLAVTRKQERYYDAVGRPLNFRQGIMLPLQDMPPVYLENNGFFILRGETILETRDRIGKRPYLYEIPEEEAVDIDWPLDLKWAEFLLNERG